MTNQEILANGPEGWTHVTDAGFYFKETEYEVYGFFNNEWVDYSHDQHLTRSRSDIERIVYLESVLKGEMA